MSAIRWTDISENTPLNKLIQLLNRRLQPNPASKDPSLQEVVIDGGGTVITTGLKLLFPLENSFAWDLTGWAVVSDQAAGSCVLDIWSRLYSASGVPTVADTITAAAKPTLVAQQKNATMSLTGWRTRIPPYSIWGINVDSNTLCQRIALTVSLNKVLPG